MTVVYIALTCLTLVVFCQQYFISKLVNKLMSRNYYDYEISHGVNKKPEVEEPKKYPVTDNEFDELDYLNSM